MRALVRLDNLSSERGKTTILRNLSRIMDIRVIDIDIQNKAMCFLFQHTGAFDEVKNELQRIGFPIQKVLQMVLNGKKKIHVKRYEKWHSKLE